MRKRARTGRRPVYPEVEGAIASSDPWANVPDHQRTKVVEVLESGAVLTTYVDTLEDLQGSQWGPELGPAPDPDPDPMHEDAPPPPTEGRKPVQPSRFASYAMPGHDKSEDE